MSIKTLIIEDMKTAMKLRDKVSLSTIRLIIDRIQKKEKDLLRDASDEEAVQVIQTFKKQTEEELEAFGKANNSTKVLELKHSLEIVVRYLPAQLSKEDLAVIVLDKANRMQVAYSLITKGDLMKAVMPHLKGKADNKVISQAVDEFLRR